MTAKTTTSASRAEPRAFMLLKSKRRLNLLNPDPNAWTDEDLAAWPLAHHAMGRGVTMGASAVRRPT
jgi:hypothetical protein